MSSVSFSGKFPIGAWISPPPAVASYGKSFIEDEYFRLAADAGLNCLYALYENLQDNREETIKALKLCEKYGIYYLLNDKTMRADDFDEQAFARSAEMYSPYSSFAGLHVKDEPGIVQFDMLKRKKDAFEKIFSEKLFYVNLLPSYATPYQLKNGMWTEEDKAARAEYGNYIDEFLKTVAPRFLSYDFYPMEGEFPNIKEGYFENLSLISEKAQTANIPFWVFIQVCAFNPNVRVPNAAEIFWQVNTALAYGAKGIQYFTYFQPADSVYETFRGGMISDKGRPTASYDAVKKINKHLSACGNILIDARLTKVEHGDFLISEFDDGKKKYSYIVNLSLTEEKTVRINDCVAVVRGETVRGNTFTLGAGEGILTVLKGE